MIELKRLIKQLESLLGDPYVREEMRIYRCAYNRLKVRFRNNKFIATMKQLVTLNQKLQADYTPEILKTYSNRLDSYKGKKFDRSLDSLMKLTCDLVLLLDNVIERSMFIYCTTEPHLKIGHLTHHLIIVRTSISRLRVCFKAMLVYASDILMEISKQFNRTGPLDQKQILEILLKHECKPRVETKIEVIDVTNEMSSVEDEVGQLIDRKTMKPVTT